MKPSLVPIACGTALAVMAGAAAAHWSSVRDMVRLAGATPSAVPSRPASKPIEPAPLPDERNAREAEALLAQARGDARPAATPVKTGSATKIPAQGGEERFERFLSAMEGILEENRQLRDNIADTNRDLMELQFRVDMYDGEFRPLKVEEEPQMYDGGDTGVLPPLDASFDTP